MRECRVPFVAPIAMRALVVAVLATVPAFAPAASAQSGERYFDCELSDGSRIGFAIDPAEKTVRRPEGPERRASEYTDSRIAAALRDERIEFNPADNTIVVTPIIDLNGVRLPAYKDQSTGDCVTAAAWRDPPPYRQALAAAPVDNIVTIGEPGEGDAAVEVIGEAAEQPASGGRAGVIVRAVNLRAGPSTGSPTVRILSGGSRVAILSCDGWCRIEADGSVGWVYQDFVTAR